MEHKFSNKCVIFAVLAVLFALGLSSCGAKEPVTADRFQEVMAAAGYNVLDITEDYAEEPYIEKCVGFADADIHVEFFEIANADEATSFFNINKDSVESYKSSVSSESSSSRSTYQRYSLKTGEKYYVVERIESTVIYSYITKDRSDDLKKLLGEIGY